MLLEFKGVFSLAAKALISIKSEKLGTPNCEVRFEPSNTRKSFAGSIGESPVASGRESPLREDFFYLAKYCWCFRNPKQSGNHREDDAKPRRIFFLNPIRWRIARQEVWSSLRKAHQGSRKRKKNVRNKREKTFWFYFFLGASFKIFEENISTAHQYVLKFLVWNCPKHISVFGFCWGILGHASTEVFFFSGSTTWSTFPLAFLRASPVGLLGNLGFLRAAGCSSETAGWVPTLGGGQHDVIAGVRLLEWVFKHLTLCLHRKTSL